MSRENIVTLPSASDIHVHCRQPGQVWKETYRTASMAAAAGGVTQMLDMPNNMSADNTPLHTNTFQRVLKKFSAITEAKPLVDIGLYFGVDETSLPLFRVLLSNTFAGKRYKGKTTGHLNVTGEEKEEEFVKNFPDDRILAVHALGENAKLMLDLARIYGKRIHLAHASTKQEIEYVIQAKKERPGMVTTEVTPHHFTLCHHDVEELGALAKMQPQISTQLEDREAILYYLGAEENPEYGDAVDAIATDHAPHTLEEKEHFSEVTGPFVVPGLETFVPLTMDLVHRGVITLERAVKLWHDNPKRIFGLPNHRGSYIEVDLNAVQIPSEKQLYTNVHWTPFRNEIYGKVLSTFLRGEQIYHHEDGFGQALGTIMYPTTL